MTASNSVLTDYASHYYEYGVQDRVVLETVEGGEATFTEGHDSSDFNVWAWKTVETRPDSSQVIVYTNCIGQFLIKARKASEEATDLWIEAFQYDNDGRQILHAHPSAVIGYDEGEPKLANLAAYGSKELYLGANHPPGITLLKLSMMA